jgi:hypothetical protein
MAERDPGEGAETPGDGARTHLATRRAGAGSRPTDAPGRVRPASLFGGWAEWGRRQPGLAAACLLFCVVAIVGLVMSLPRGVFFTGRTGRPASGASVRAPAPPLAARPENPTPDTPRPPAAATPPATPAQIGPWVEEDAAAPSARGLAVVYRHRTLPPGAESRYEWIVQLRGAQPVLDGVDVVTWRMDPPAKNGTDFESRDRAADGFPLFGHGPGGWFGVAATIRYRDAVEETLARRIELPD